MPHRTAMKGEEVRISGLISHAKAQIPPELLFHAHRGWLNGIREEALTIFSAEETKQLFREQIERVEGMEREGAAA